VSAPSTTTSTTTGAGPRQPLFDLSGIDLSGMVMPPAELERWLPHRTTMALLDGIVWHSPDFHQGVAAHITRDDEFWVSGHFPGRPMLPGVLMVEMGAQVALFLYNKRMPRPKVAAFTRIEDCTFRAAVAPGDRLFILCQEHRLNSRMFISDVQGWIEGKRLAFEARITGVSIDQYMDNLFPGVSGANGASTDGKSR
jgi:3-hydroxyacyl-[acyl-carrier-protein] dehydratase